MYLQVIQANPNITSGRLFNLDFHLFPTVRTIIIIFLHFLDKALRIVDFDTFLSQTAYRNDFNLRRDSGFRRIEKFEIS